MNKVEKILIVEDDISLSAGLCFELESEKYITVAAYSIQKAKQLLESETFNLAILDVNLPDGNGFELCKHIKKIIPTLPVLFLTANDLEKDILIGFDLGAEDYIIKPFNINILRKKIGVALRNGTKQENQDKNIFNDGYLQIDFDGLSAVRNGEKLAITPNEYKILKLLFVHSGNIVTRQLLLERLWDCDGNFIDDHTLTVNMTRLRGKLEDETHSYIKTIRGMGYVWIGGKNEKKN